MILHEVLTTERVPFTYRVAGLGSRFLAWLVDFGLMILLVFAGSCLGGVAAIGRQDFGGALTLAAMFGVQFGYFLLFEWLWHGQTPGKHLLGIRVVTLQGTGMSFLQSAARNILRVADAMPLLLPVFYPLGFAVALCNREQRRLGDLASGTLVVHVERRARPIQALPESLSAALRAWKAQVRQRLNQLDRAQKQTVLDLCLRRDQLRLAERARLFRAVTRFFQEECGLAPEQYQSDEKFVLALAAELGARGEEPAELAMTSG